MGCAFKCIAVDRAQSIISITSARWRWRRHWQFISSKRKRCTRADVPWVCVNVCTRTRVVGIPTWILNNQFESFPFGINCSKPVSSVHYFYTRTSICCVWLRILGYSRTPALTALYSSANGVTAWLRQPEQKKVETIALLDRVYFVQWFTRYLFPSQLFLLRRWRWWARSAEIRLKQRRREWKNLISCYSRQWCCVSTLTVAIIQSPPSCICTHQRRVTHVHYYLWKSIRVRWFSALKMHLFIYHETPSNDDLINLDWDVVGNALEHVEHLRFFGK